MAAKTPRMTPRTWAMTEIPRVKAMPLMIAGLGWKIASQKNCGLMFALLVQPPTENATNTRHPASKTRRVPGRMNDNGVIETRWLWSGKD